MRRWTAFAVMAIAASLALVACAPPNRQQGQPSPTSTPGTSKPSTGAAGGGAAGGAATGQAGAQTFTAALDAINSSTASGTATVTVTPQSGGGTTVRVQVAATGLVPDMKHAMHIHALPNGQPSVCPSTPPGSITTEPVAEQSYGPVVVPLEPFPMATPEGMITYDQQVNVPASLTGAMEGRAIVLHGLMVNGAYDPAVPVACGTLKPWTGAAAGSGAATQSMPATESTQTTP